MAKRYVAYSSVGDQLLSSRSFDRCPTSADAAGHSNTASDSDSPNAQPWIPFVIHTSENATGRGGVGASSRAELGGWCSYCCSAAHGLIDESWLRLSWAVVKPGQMRRQ